MTLFSLALLRGLFGLALAKFEVLLLGALTGISSQSQFLNFAQPSRSMILWMLISAPEPPDYSSHTNRELGILVPEW